MTKKAYRDALIAGAGALALAGCAGGGDRYPSLAVRDAERAVGTFTPSVPDQNTPVYTTDRRRIGDALEQARSSHERFLAEQPVARDLAQAAAGRGPESDRRSRALVALADLTVLHAETTIALADLDRLELEAATVFAPTEEIRTAQEYIARLVSEQDAALDSLTEVMGL